MARDWEVGLKAKANANSDKVRKHYCHGGGTMLNWPRPLLPCRKQCLPIPASQAARSILLVGRLPRAVSTLSIRLGHPTVLFLSRLCHPQGSPLSGGRPAVPQGKRKSPGPSPQPCSAAAPPTHALSDWDIITTSLSPVS